jgi:hypothetical protein
VVNDLSTSSECVRQEQDMDCVQGIPEALVLVPREKAEMRIHSESDLRKSQKMVFQDQSLS